MRPVAKATLCQPARIRLGIRRRLQRLHQAATRSRQPRPMVSTKPSPPGAVPHIPGLRAAQRRNAPSRAAAGLCSHRCRAARQSPKEAAKAIDEARRINERPVEGFVKSADTAAQRVESLRDEAAAADLAAKSGMSLAQAVEAVHIAKLQEQQTQLLGNEEAVLAIQRDR